MFFHLRKSQVSEFSLTIESTIEGVGIEPFDSDFVFEIDGEPIELNSFSLIPFAILLSILPEIIIFLV